MVVVVEGSVTEEEEVDGLASVGPSGFWGPVSGLLNDMDAEFCNRHSPSVTVLCFVCVAPYIGHQVGCKCQYHSLGYCKVSCIAPSYIAPPRI